jgi:V-type H+-transporting ATPase subunit C
VYDSSKSGGIKGQIEKAGADLKQYRTSTIHWCQTHFGEVYGAWIHLKLIQAFVESVLRYGLPVDFTSFFVRPDSKQEKEVRTVLVTSILSLRPELKPKKALIDEEEEEDSESNLPFVLLKFSAIGLSHNV